ncbi:AAA family ATPase [Ramlibacter sp. G-1-2-2]|uniref:AAA family ATPase n=1 Tax=Ramlibacter agri TaxID=2728837 RepID=A0A848H2B3_9BURK|nr:AAA family ATPase [Ramlibacter agri]NML43649.1 AAA family ATPase [Ramlibacter agri]
MGPTCPRCGRRTRPDARFCDGCGLALAPSADEGAHDHARAPELALLERRMRAALAGNGGAVALCGEPGIGKSHTAQEAARRAAALGLRVLWARCNEEAGAPPYWPWRQLLQAWAEGRDDAAQARVLGSAAAPLADLLPELAARLPKLPPLPRVDALQARFRLFDAMAGFWRRATADEPLLLIVDNLHWADASSLRLLEFLAPELSARALLVLATYREMELTRQHPLSGTLGELSAQPGFDRLHLGGLDRRHTAHMMGRAAGAVPPAALVDEVYRRTEGNPLFIAEMTRLLAQEGLLGTAADPAMRASRRIPEGIKEVIGRRLNRLSAATNQVLACAAVIGRGFDTRLLARVLDDADEDACPLALEEALQARLLEALAEPGRYRFAHALFRETLYEEIAPPRRSRLHLRVAQAIEAAGDDDPHAVAALAFHHAAALPGGDPQRAVDCAQRAAEQATAMQAHEEAARYLRLALQALEARSGWRPGLRSALLDALGEAHSRAGDYLLAQQVFEQAAQIALREQRPTELARAALGLEVATWCPGMPGGTAARWLRAALEEAEPEDVATAARLLASLARALIYSGEETQAMQVYAQALAAARRCGDPRILATTLIATVSLRWHPELRARRRADAEEASRLATAAGDRALAVEASAWTLFDRFEAGDIAGYRTGLAAYERDAEDLRDRFMRYVAAASRTMLALLEGRLAEVETLARNTLAIGDRMPGLDAAGVYGVQMFTLRREQGRLAEVAPALQAFVQGDAAKPWRPGLALLYVELDQPDAARREFELLAQDGFAALPRDGVWAASTAYLAQVCVALGDTARAGQLYAMLRPYAGSNLLAGTSIACVGAADMLLGMLAGVQRRWEAADQHFTAALALNAAQGARPALAHTRRHYADLLLARNRGGDRSRAAALLAEAGAEAEALGMRALAQRVAALQVQAGAAPAPAYPAGLSEREAQVLRFVAAGKSNRQIAEVLFVSPNTVANHVRSILSKTQSANRTEAAAFAIRNELGPA